MAEGESEDVTSAPAEAMLTPSVELPSKVAGVRDREVDIVAEGEVSGHKVVLGIECRASNRPASIEWVERMYGKHQHLYIDRTVLVSSSGFTKGALRLAEFLGMKAITPGEVEPGFVGDIVNNLQSLWVEAIDLAAEKIVFDVDPPINSSPSGRFVEVRPDTWTSVALYLTDSTEVGSVGQLVTELAHRVDLSQVKPGEALGENRRFTLTEDKPPTYRGEPLHLRGGDDPEPPTTLRRITGYVIDGSINAGGAEMPLAHGQYDGTNYSSGTAKVGDRRLDWAVTEGEDGTRVGLRVLPICGSPTTAQSFQSSEGAR